MTWTAEDTALMLAGIERQALESVRARCAAEQLGECFTGPSGPQPEAECLTRGERTMPKTYTNRSNANRAGTKQFGKGNYKVHKVDGGKFQPIANQAQGKKHPGNRAPVAPQPQMQALLKAIAKGGGKTVGELQLLLGKVASHTVRGAISRLRAEKLAIVSTREGRIVRYSLAA